MTSDGNALLQAVLENPADDAPRLVFADWLQEFGTEADVAWAAYIRASCELAALEEDGATGVDPMEGHTCSIYPCPLCAQTDRYHELLEECRSLMVKQVPHPAGGHSSLELVLRGPVRLVEMPGLHDYMFRRGFISEIECEANDWLACANRICAVHPIEIVKVRNISPWADVTVWGMPRGNEGKYWKTSRWPRIKFETLSTASGLRD